MTAKQTDDKQRDHRGRRGEGTIYWDEKKKCYRGELSLGLKPNGKRNRPIVYGQTKAAVRDEFDRLRKEQSQGIRTSATYTVKEAVEEFLRRGLPGRDSGTRAKIEILARKHVIPSVGGVAVSKLTADDVDDWLANKATTLSTRSLSEILAVLRRALKHAQRRDRLGRNVAELVELPEGQTGRPSRALPIEGVIALLNASRGRPFHSYLVLSLMTGVRTEEARALTWKHVHLEQISEVPPHVEVWRSVRRGGDTKTRKSRRSIELPVSVVDVLVEHRKTQDMLRSASDRWEDNDLVFCTRHGTPLDAANVRRSLRATLKAAGLDPVWTPRELRHSFVSLMSAAGAPIELISRLVGHTDTSVTEAVYRHELKPVITGGAEIMNRLFGADSAG
ncbi:site-specific integrase [Stackebrandtia soli]|uniref:site-specific integrase n=1 Tax=Stackebrandtia soli TaxID=1892856 RepID=UPI0039E962F3